MLKDKRYRGSENEETKKSAKEKNIEIEIEKNGTQ